MIVHSPADKLSAVGLLRQLKDGILDLVYPPKCVVCGDIQALYLCDDCKSKILELEDPLCDRCGLPLDDGPCPECQRTRFPFETARAYGVYEGTLREAVHQLKYACRSVVAPELGELLVAYCLEHPNFAAQASCVVPVPIHHSRQRERGFNQSRLISGPLAVALRIPLITDALTRRKPGIPQTGLSLEERMSNIRGVFEVVNEQRICGARILLVDDVLTTGATCGEAAAVLLSAGAKSVYVLTLARAC